MKVHSGLMKFGRAMRLKQKTNGNAKSRFHFSIAEHGFERAFRHRDAQFLKTVWPDVDRLVVRDHTKGTRLSVMREWFERENLQYPPTKEQHV
jgi:hypothetical protein